MEGRGAAATSLCVLTGCAASDQQLGSQAFYLSVLGGQEPLQLGDFCLREKAEDMLEGKRAWQGLDQWTTGGSRKLTCNKNDCFHADLRMSGPSIHYCV